MKGKAIRILALFICAVAVSSLATMRVSAQEGDVSTIRSGHNISLKIYFPYDESYVDSTYMANRVNLHLADSLLRNTSFMCAIETVEITAQSSPEGSILYNTRLSERRRVSQRSTSRCR
ncbi:MAG: hypothetical protein R3Y68_01465 [Rikenellaceae bacterium]